MYTAANQLLDTTRMVTMHSGPGMAIYVMSFEGHLYVSPHSVGHRHHSSLLAGATVTGAGEIKVVQGRLVSISNKSGHYQPDTFILLQTIHSLIEQGLANDFQVVTMMPRNAYPSFMQFLAAQKCDDTTVECMWISEGFHHVLTNQFLAANALWFQPCSIPGGLKGGMYTTARGTYEPITMTTSLLTWQTSTMFSRYVGAFWVIGIERLTRNPRAMRAACTQLTRV